MSSADAEADVSVPFASLPESKNVLQSLLFLFVGLVSHQKSVELCAGCWGWAGAAGQRGDR